MSLIHILLQYRSSSVQKLEHMLYNNGKPDNSFCSKHTHTQREREREREFNKKDRMVNNSFHRMFFYLKD